MNDAIPFHPENPRSLLPKRCFSPQGLDKAFLRDYGDSFRPFIQPLFGAASFVGGGGV